MLSLCKYLHFYIQINQYHKKTDYDRSVFMWNRRYQSHQTHLEISRFEDHLIKSEPIKHLFSFFFLQHLFFFNGKTRTYPLISPCEKITVDRMRVSFVFFLFFLNWNILLYTLLKFFVYPICIKNKAFLFWLRLNFSKKLTVLFGKFIYFGFGRRFEFSFIFKVSVLFCRTKSNQRENSTNSWY